MEKKVFLLLLPELGRIFFLDREFLRLSPATAIYQ